VDPFIRYAFDPTHWNCYERGLGYPSAYTHGVARGGYRLSPGVLAARNQRQYEMDFGGGEPFMMLVSDMCLWYDEVCSRFFRCDSFLFVLMAHQSLTTHFPPPSSAGVPASSATLR
jgi:hypothetical protein